MLKYFFDLTWENVAKQENWTPKVFYIGGKRRGLNVYKQNGWTAMSLNGHAKKVLINHETRNRIVYDETTGEIETIPLVWRNQIIG